MMKAGREILLSMSRTCFFFVFHLETNPGPGKKRDHQPWSFVIVLVEDELCSLGEVCLSSFLSPFSRLI
jgi:hypothetical protein